MGVDYEAIIDRAKNNAGYEVQQDIAMLINELKEMKRLADKWQAISNAMANEFRFHLTASNSLVLYERARSNNI